MTTKKEYADQCRAENPKPMFATVNGERIELTDEEYETAIEQWALMKWYQDHPEEQPKRDYGY